MIETPMPQRWAPARALTLLFLANVLNIADRALLGIVSDPVKRDLGLTDTELSIVNGLAFVLFNLVVGLVIAGWADRANRKRILVAGMALWSAATALSGLAQDFYSLAATRILVGVGEATAFPVALSMIADLYAAPKRPRAVAIFQSSTFIGVVLGSIVAGVLASAHGWRSMFLICGIAGFALVALLMVALREPERAHQEVTDGSVPDVHGLGTALATIARIPGFAWLALGYAASGMAVAVLPVWAPTFLLRSHDVDLAAVGAVIGPAVGIGGIAGTLIWGVVASFLVRRRGSEKAALLVPLFALPLAVPCYAIFVFAPSLGATMGAAAVMNFLMGSSLGACVALAVGIAPVRMRGVASTLMLVAQGLIGAALAPLLVGALSDALAPAYGTESLRYALAAMIAAPGLAALLLWVAWRRIAA